MEQVLTKAPKVSHFSREDSQGWQPLWSAPGLQTNR